MKENNNGLNVYSSGYKIDETQKKIYKISAFIFAFFVVSFSVLTIFFPFVYSLIVGYVTGALVSVLLFYFLNKYVNETYFKDLKKALKRIHLLHQIIYLLSFASLTLIFKTYYVVIGVTLGLLLIKMAILLAKRKL